MLGLNRLGDSSNSFITEYMAPFRDVITGGIFDILQESKPAGYDERASYTRGIKNDLYGLKDTITSRKSLIQKTDEALQRIASIADGVRVSPTTTLEDKLKDLGYGIFHDFYERTMRKYGKKLERVNSFFNSLGSVGSSFINIFGLNDNSIISNAKAGTSRVFKSMNADYVQSIAGKDLFSTGLYFGEYARFMMEDLGYIWDTTKSIAFSRDYAFVHRPFLESDNTG